MTDMATLIASVLQFVTLLGQGFLLQGFCGRFLEYRFIKHRWNGPGITFLYGAVAWGMDFLFVARNDFLRILGKKGLTLCLIILLVGSFYRAGRSISVFLIITFLAVSDICFLLAYMLMPLGGELVNMLAVFYAEGYFLSDKVFLNMVEAVWIITMLVMYIFFLLLFYFCLKRIVGSFREKDYPMQSRELLFVVTPGLTGFFLCLLLRFLMITMENGQPQLLYNKYPPLVILVPFILLLSLMSICYCVKLFQDMVILHRERSSRVVLERQLLGLQEQVGEIERVYANVRSMKHDMRNTLGVILQLAEAESGKEELRNYLAELQQSFEGMEALFETGNVVADTLLQMKYHEALLRTPDMVFEAEDLIFPKHLEVQSFDIGIILGNALDNALEACGKYVAEKGGEKPYIRVASFLRGRMFFLEIENTFYGQIIRRSGEAFPSTDKEDKSIHGMGLLNIKKTAEKYHGGVDYEVKGNRFILMVMLQNEKEDEKDVSQ